MPVRGSQQPKEQISDQVHEEALKEHLISGTLSHSLWSLLCRTSMAGRNWTIRTSAADNSWYSVCWSPELGLFVAVASSGTGNRVMTSPDGVTWTIRTSAADNNWRSVCWSPELGLFVAVAYSGTGDRVMTSSVYSGNLLQVLS